MNKLDTTYEAVVGAAYRLSGARISTGTDDSERGAGNSAMVGCQYLKLGKYS